MNDINLKILEKLNILVKLTTLNIVMDHDYREQVRILSLVGLKPKEIADLLGKTSNSVRVTLSGIRRSKNKVKTKKLNSGEV